MPTGQATPGPEPSRDELVAACEALRRRVEELEQEKRDLEVMLETATEHADHLSADLEQERNDLATMLAMTTEHADTVEDELHENAAEALLRSARQLRMIVEATPAPVLISRLADAEIVYANAMTGALFGAPAQELLGRGTPELYYDPADRATIIETLEAQSFVDHHEVRFKRLDGTLVWVDVSLRRLDFNDEPSILSALHDITERKEAEQRLQQQVDELRLELEETSQSAALARSTGTTRFDNLDAAVIERGSTRLVAFHSFRGGNGKSSIAANVAGLLAASGQRVGVVDADLQSPGMHVLLGQAGKRIDRTLNDFLLGNCGVDQLAIDVTAGLGQPVPGQLFLVPASVNPGAMAQVLSQGYEAQRLTQSFHELAKLLQLDVLLVDTHPGLNEEALLTMRAVQTLIVVLRPDAQDLEGTGVTVQVARQLEVPQLMLLVNQLPATGQLHAVRARVEQTFKCEVAAILPQAAEFMTFDNDGLFALRHAGHPISVALRHLATRLTGATAQVHPS
jgi:septum site-determining protein MinD